MSGAQCSPLFSRVGLKRVLSASKRWQSLSHFPTGHTCLVSPCLCGRRSVWKCICLRGLVMREWFLWVVVWGGACSVVCVVCTPGYRWHSHFLLHCWLQRIFSFYHSLEMLCFDNKDMCDNTWDKSLQQRYKKKKKKTGFGSGVVVSELLCKGTLLPLKAFLCPTTTTKVPVNNIMAVDHSESNFHFWHAFSAMRVGSSLFFNLCDRGSRCGQGR